MQITCIQGVSGSVKETGYHVQNFRNILSLPKQMTHKFVLTYHSADNTSLAQCCTSFHSLEVVNWNELALVLHYTTNSVAQGLSWIADSCPVGQ
jgi:hypothetical protein